MQSMEIQRILVVRTRPLKAGTSLSSQPLTVPDQVKTITFNTTSDIIYTPDIKAYLYIRFNFEDLVIFSYRLYLVPEYTNFTG